LRKRTRPKIGHSDRPLQIVYRAIAELKLYPTNPRDHKPRDVGQIARSIETFGFIVPVLIDANGRVIAGHGRILACQLLGRTEVPTIIVDHLSEVQARAFMIADNRLTENSVWNEQLLAQQLKELSVVDLGFSLEVTGFDMGEIDLRIESLTSVAALKDDPLDAIPAETNAPAVSHTGDLWLLGHHRVFCGSALDESSYDTLMAKKKAAMVFTDPPYNVPIEGNVSGLGAIHHRDFVMASGEMSSREFASFLIRAFSLLAKNSANGSLQYIFMDWRHMEELLSAGRTVYSILINLCIWVKNHTGMGNFYRSRHELVFVFRNGSARPRNNVQLGRYGRDRTNIWIYPGPRTPSEEGNLLAMHPTVKPCALVADAIIDCTSRNDIVLDGFLGSGTTVIAAERTGRHCYGLEVDPLYVDTIVRRWQAFTRGDAHHALSGKSFREMEADARRCDATRKTAITK
jgi:DNA modification methylase